MSRCCKCSAEAVVLIRREDEDAPREVCRFHMVQIIRCAKRDMMKYYTAIINI